jgi:hypothetical protein
MPLAKARAISARKEELMPKFQLKLTFRIFGFKVNLKVERL